MGDKIEIRSYWQDVMNQYSASGQTQKQFCEANGISFKKFKYHRYQIIPPATSKLMKTKPSKQFTEIKIKSEPSLNMIKIKYPNGCECYLPFELPKETLTAILKEVSTC